MARIRTIKPEFWKNEELSALPESVHMLAAALLNYADDEGYFNANLGLIKAECFPLREPSVSVHESLIMLSDIGYLRLNCGSDGRQYGHVVKFSEHQRVNRPTPSKIRELFAHGKLTEPSLPERKGKEGKGKEHETRERVALGEEFWKVYPHPKNPGGKLKVVEGINKLPSDEQKSAIASIPKLLDAIADQRKKIRDYQAPMAQTYVNQRRWEGFENVSRETSAPVVLPDEEGARNVAERVLRAIGHPAYASWFTHNGRALIEKNCSGFILRQANLMQADKWKNDYRGMLDDVVGKGSWRIEPLTTG